MLKVPILPDRDVEPEGYSGRQVIDAPLDAFGAAQARALADAGEAVDEVADLAETIFRKEQAKSMEIERLEAEAKTRAAADKVLNGALSRTGKDALGVTTEVDQALEKMERDTIANADPANHDKLTAHVGGLRRQAGGTTAAHEARQKDGYRDVLLADSIDRHREGAISAYDPERNPDPAARAVGPIRRRLVMLTPDAEPADIERRLAAEMSGIHERVVSGLVEDGRGAEALAYLGRAMETNAIAAERVDDLRALTAITVVDEAVLDKTNEILARHKGDHDSQLAAARTIESPELRLGVERYLGHAKAGDTRAERERVDRRLMAAAAKAGQQGATLTATDKAVMTPTAQAQWHARHTAALAGQVPAFNAAADDDLTDMIMRDQDRFAAMSLPAYFAEHAMTEGQRNAFIAAQDMLKKADPAELAQLRRKTASYLSGYAAMRRAADSAGIDWRSPPGSADARHVVGLKTAVRDNVDHHAATNNDRVPTRPDHEAFAASHMMGVTGDAVAGAAPGSSPAGGSDVIPTGGVETQYLQLAAAAAPERPSAEESVKQAEGPSRGPTSGTFRRGADAIAGSSADAGNASDDPTPGVNPVLQGAGYKFVEGSDRGNGSWLDPNGKPATPGALREVVTSAIRERAEKEKWSAGRILAELHKVRSGLPRDDSKNIDVALAFLPFLAFAGGGGVTATGATTGGAWLTSFLVALGLGAVLSLPGDTMQEGEKRKGSKVVPVPNSREKSEDDNREVVRVYRVETADRNRVGEGNARIMLYEDGSVQIRREDGKELHVNLGDRRRAIEYLDQKLERKNKKGQKLKDPVIKSFDVPKEFADKIRSAAIPIEGSSKKDPKQLLPRKVDYPVTDESFQLIGAWIDALQAHIIQGTGEMETEKDVKKERKKFQNE